MAKLKFRINGMHCPSCAKLIERAVKEINGVKEIKADYDSGTGFAEFDEAVASKEAILKAIEKEGYECAFLNNSADNSAKQPGHKEEHSAKEHNTSCSEHENADELEQEMNENVDKKVIGYTFGIIGLILLIYFGFRIFNGIELPQITENMGYGLLFLVGLLTGFHCVSMCGGFVVSYTLKDAKEGRSSYKSHLMYAVGKTLSYTLIGAAFGFLGSIFAFTPAMRGAAGIIAGLFLVVFGLNMLNITPWLRRIRIRMPSALSRFVDAESAKHNNPLVIGLLNGLMIACGPLQAIYIMAAGTGSMVEGAKMLFVFGIGTLPVMLGFGFITSMLSAKATHKILKASGAIVIILGLIMINRGLALAGTGLDSSSFIAAVSASENKAAGNVAVIGSNYQTINMDVTRYGWEPDQFILKKGVPVRWVINGKEITGCNNAIQVPKLGLRFDIKPGQQVIEFTPTEEGIIPWSCWMGMIRGTFIVKEDINLNNQAAIKEELAKVPKQQGGSCGGGSSGCGCGARR